jgi:hypothetical protein
VQESSEEKLGAGDCVNRNVEGQWNNIKKCLLDTMSDCVGKVEKSKKAMDYEGNGTVSIMQEEEKSTED